MDNDKAKTTSLHTGEDPVVIKIARLALILADKDYDTGTKQLCIKAAESRTSHLHRWQRS